MKKKKRVVTVISIIIGVIVILGIWAVAETNYGSQSDPLITLSYITDVFTGQITEKLNEQMDTRITELKTDLEASIAELESRYGEQDSGKKFVLVTLTEGQILTGSVGTELMLRVGTAQCYASASPGLIDSTSAGIIENGESLEKNHMYMITIEGRGIKATSSNVMVLVRGDHEIS